MSFQLKPVYKVTILFAVVFAATMFLFQMIADVLAAIILRAIGLY